MRRTFPFIVASVVAALVMILASLVPMTGGINIARAKQAQAKSCVTAPAPRFVGATKKYAGQQITYYGDAVGCGHDMDVAAISQFQKDTGIKVKIVEKPTDSDQAYATYSRLFQNHSPNIDVMMLDVIWPSAFAQNLMDLKGTLGSLAKKHYASIVRNDTIGGRLVGIPWFADFGMLYYRKDLLNKYHLAVPTTWQELGKAAAKIQAGERKAGKKNFYGYVFQGKAYEGLTCNSLEWLASSGGGTFVQNGRVTLNNKNAANVLNLVKSWVGTISPRDVTTYTEVESDNAFNAGNVAFLRNWPYALAAAQKAGLTGKVGVAPLPHGAGQVRSVGTVGGWQLGVSQSSRHPQAAMELVRYLAGVDVETWRAVVATFVPSIPSVASKSAVIKAEPFLGPMGPVIRVTRPSRSLGTKYNQASNIIWTGINQILNGADANSVLPGTAAQLQRLTR